MKERLVNLIDLRHKVDDLLSVCPDFDQVLATADFWSDLYFAAIAAVAVLIVVFDYSAASVGAWYGYALIQSTSYHGRDSFLSVLFTSSTAAVARS